MDAANTSTKSIALFFGAALLMAVPFRAEAQPQFVFPGGNALSINGTGGDCLQVSSSGAPITFTSTQEAVAGDGNPRLAASPSPATTDTQVCFSVFNVGGVGPSPRTITFDLNPSSPAGVNPAHVTITWNASGGSGGNGGNSGSGLSSNTTLLTMQSVSGGNGSSNFTLSNTTSGQISYSTNVTYTNGSGWLSFPNGGSSGTILPGGIVQINVQANPAGLPANTTSNANLVISYSGGGSGTITIPVQFAVGNNTSTGNLVMTPNPVNLNYVTGSNSAPFQQVSIASSAPTYDATVTSGGSWLLVNNQSQLQGASTGSGLFISTILSNIPSANATGTIVVTDSNGNSGTLTVNLTINGQSNGLSISPSPVNLTASVGQTAQAQAAVTISSNTPGTLAVSSTGTGISAQLTNNTIGAGGTAQMTIYGNPSGLSANTYQGTVTVTLNGVTTAAVNVNFVVGGSSSNSGIVAPTSLQFAFQTGTPLSGSGSSLVPQFITEGVAGSFSITNKVGNWLTVTPTSGTGPALLTVSADATGLSSGTNSGSFVVTTSAGSQTVNVTLLVTSAAVMFANPGVVNVSYTAGSANPSTNIQVLVSDGSNIPVSVTGVTNWLTVTPSSANSPSSFFVTIGASTLPNGVNVGSVTFSSGVGNSPLVVPVVVTVSGSTSSGGTLTLGASALSFNGVVNGSAPSSQTLSVTASSSTPYTAGTSVSNGGNWLSISPSGSLNTSSTSNLTVSVNQAGLSTGTYTGSINLVTSSGTQTVPVTLVVGSATNTGSVQATPSSLTFNSQVGGGAPGTQGFNVSSTNSNNPNVNFTVATTTASGGSWLSTNVGAGINVVAPFPVTATVNPTGLTAGTYTGSIVLTPAGGTPVNVPVTLVVQGLPTVSASPTTLSLAYSAGSSAVPTGTLQVTGSAANLNFTASASSSGWLAVTPTSGTTGTGGTALTVTANTAGLTAGTYNGTITVAGTSGAAGSTTVNVTLTVTAPLPTISAVINAASGASGPVSPGEIVSIFAPASNPIGPSTPVGLTLDSNGNVSTTLGGVQVLFSGVPAPLTFVSSTQINAVVPYQVAGLFQPFVQVKYLGQNSNSFSVSTTSTAPGIFTQNASGTGPGAVLNQDFSTNGTAAGTKPATKGSTIQVFMTGEGSTSPAGVTGKVTCSNCAISQLPVPLLPVTVTFIDSNNVRYPANYTFAGSAPGFVSGVMQVNVTVPSNVPSGILQLVIGVGSNNSQAGVTVAVQ